MMKPIWKRCINSFFISMMCGMVTNILVELIGEAVSGDPGFSAFTPEYLALCPSETIAAYINVFFYGVIGAAFSGFLVIYEWDRLGFVIQNILYVIATGLVWIPIAVFVWRLPHYLEVVVTVGVSFLLTYVIMTIVGYNIQKKEIANINEKLRERRGTRDDRA